MDQVARMPPQDRADLFTAAASRRNLTHDIIEKDFWVCWVLKRLFTLQNPPAKLLFKGGTSLSKVFGAVQRFSEDVDLSFDRSDLGFGGDRDPAKASSGKKRKSGLEELSADCAKLVEGEYRDRLKSQIADALGKTDESWELIVADEDAQTLLFDYPSHVSKKGRTSYVRPIIRLEFGARSDHWPTRTGSVMPYAAEASPQHFKDPKCSVEVLAGERTFWEKATLLHMWFHAPSDKHFGDRQSRHYYDVAMLSLHEIGKNAIADRDLLLKVAEHKKVFFPAAWAHYETAKPGTLRLTPAPTKMSELERDYDKMKEMIFGPPKPLAEVLRILKELEDQFNRA